jgi:CRISPR/Cas system Type II protein with McrA/HNH and RuvC-like nuclease domain
VFGYKEALEHIGGLQTKCYLTGRAINIENSEEYELDHIIPVSKDGSCELTNMGIACVAANQAKKDLSVEEFIQLCKEVCENFGYEVKKK